MFSAFIEGCRKNYLWQDEVIMAQTQTPIANKAEANYDKGISSESVFF